MRRALLFLPLALAACATPREQCISGVTRDLRVITGLINETQGNIARGYAIEEEQDVRTIRSRCTGRAPDGTEFSYSCPRVVTFDRDVPVAIDISAEEDKLDSLLQRQAQLQASSQAAIQQCVAIHPE